MSSVQSQLKGWLLGLQCLVGYVFLLLATAFYDPSAMSFSNKVVMNMLIVGPTALAFLFGTSATISAYKRYKRRLTMLYNGALVVEGKSTLLATRYFTTTFLGEVTHKLEFVVNDMLYEKEFRTLEMYMAGIPQNSPTIICYVANRPETAIPKKVLEHETRPVPFWFRVLYALVSGFLLLCFYSLLDSLTSLDTWPSEYWSIHWIFFCMMHPFVYFLVDEKWAEYRVEQLTSGVNVKGSSCPDYVFVPPHESSPHAKPFSGV